MAGSGRTPHLSNNEAYNSASTKDNLLVTWRNLWVTVPDGKGSRRSILQGSTGFAESGKVLAIMGPSGCGKTTLLDTLAGRLPLNAVQTGDIRINGRHQALAFGTSAYVTQDDILLTTLTVKEAVHYSAQLQLPDSMSLSEKKERADDSIREMGLQESENTRIGGLSSKGLSGGQKRRLSICMEILTCPRLLFMDEPTSGLDSAASFHVMKHVAHLARNRRRTVVVSIHQPSGEIFNFFDDLCLLTYGQTVYFGVASDIDEFFSNNGYPCPPMTNPPDHYLRIINKDFAQERGDQSAHVDHDLPLVDVNEAIETLVSSFKSSIGPNLEAYVTDISSKEGPKLRKGSHAGFLKQCIILTRRSAVNMGRDWGYYWMRFSIYLSIAFCLGTVFYQLDISYPTIADRSSVLQFLGGYLTFMTIGGFPSFVEDVKIFQRERLNGHYGVAAYVISHTLSSAPFLALVSFIPGVITYFMVGLQSSVTRFVYFELVLFMLMTLVESLMMMIASVIPDFLMGIILGAGVQGIMMLTSGFFRLPHDIPKPVWKYPVHYMAFHKYGGQGFFKNEFFGLTFPNKRRNFPSKLSGLQIVENVYEMEVGYSKWVDLAVLFGMVIAYRCMFFLINKVKEKAIPRMRAFSASPKVSCVLVCPSRNDG